MPIQIGITFDAFQVGALVAIAACFGIDGLYRKDHTMGWLSAACLLIALRHTMGLFAAYRLLGPEAEERFQSILASLGYLAMLKSLTLVLPGHFHKRFMVWLLAGVSPNLIRGLFLPLDQPPALFIHYLTLTTYLFGCVSVIVAICRIWIAGDPLGRRLGIGVVVTTLLVMAEILSILILGKRPPISGLAIMVMASTLGISWLWFITQDLQAKVAQKDAEASLWRSLIPGITWRSGESSPALNQLLGPGWNQHLGERVLGLDGIDYRVQKATLNGGEEIGWLHAVPPSAETRPGIFFLMGWHIALGIDDGESFERVRVTLEAWGAIVECWGTVPPREGPYPSILIWAREPSILTVWREGDISRRKARWIQVGGAGVEGPHARLELPLTIEALRNALQRLLSF